MRGVGCTDLNATNNTIGASLIHEKQGQEAVQAHGDAEDPDAGSDADPLET
jgi:hypothetical protein